MKYTVRIHHSEGAGHRDLGIEYDNMPDACLSAEALLAYDEDILFINVVDPSGDIVYYTDDEGSAGTPDSLRC